MRRWSALAGAMLVAAFSTAADKPSASEDLRPVRQAFIRNDTLFVRDGGELRYVPPVWTQCSGR